MDSHGGRGADSRPRETTQGQLPGRLGDSGFCRTFPAVKHKDLHRLSAEKSRASQPHRAWLPRCGGAASRLLCLPAPLPPTARLSCPQVRVAVVHAEGTCPFSTPPGMALGRLAAMAGVWLRPQSRAVGSTGRPGPALPMCRLRVGPSHCRTADGPAGSLWVDCTHLQEQRIHQPLGSLRMGREVLCPAPARRFRSQHTPQSVAHTGVSAMGRADIRPPA